MKQLIQYGLLFSLCIFLWGCPYDSPYAIDTQPSQNIDESLLGKWAAIVQRPSTDNEYADAPVKIIFEKKNEQEYEVAITGYIDELLRFRVADNDTIRGTAFISVIDNHAFLNTIIKGKVYIAEIKHDSTNLHLLTLAEHFTSRYVKNSAQLRNAIWFHYKTRAMPAYDDWFIAKNLQKVN